MPGAKRSDLISKRDLEVLEFIARFGAVPRGAVAVWAATARTVTMARERRLREAGLIEVFSGFGESGRLAVATRDGLRSCGRGELRPARLSVLVVRHESILAHLAATLERSGERVLSEREIGARERAAGERVLSAPLGGGRFHRADLIRIAESGEPREAIEVELTVKAAARLDELLRAWRRAVAERRFARVVYRCTPRTRPAVQRAIERTASATAIGVESL